jgi:hypothetical protein
MPAGSAPLLHDLVQGMLPVTRIRPHLRRPATGVDRLRPCRAGEHFRVLELHDAGIAGLAPGIDGLRLAAHREAQRVLVEEGFLVRVHVHRGGEDPFAGDRHVV